MFAVRRGSRVPITSIVLLLGLVLAFSSCSDNPTGPGGDDFGDFWDFDLTLIGEGCPGAESGRDCFRILQSGDALLIVDDNNGNITGVVTGNDATMSRQTVGVESVLLELSLDPGSGVITGSAVEADSLLGCTNNLTLVGHRRTLACGAKRE